MQITYATGKYTAATLHKRPHPGAPLLSQLLLGEAVAVVEQKDRYSRVLLPDDELEGYVLTDQLVSVEEDVYRRQLEQPAFALELFCPIFSDGFGMPVTFGARLPGYDGIQLQHAGQRFRYSGQALLSENLTADADVMLRMARKWLFTPELKGGRTPTGVGAAELIQLVCRLVGVQLPRTIPEMSRLGRSVDFVVQCQPADLAFFDDGRGRVDHVGLILPDSQVLHVCGRVRVDPLDHYGIFDRESRRYSHRLRIVRRFLPDATPAVPVRLETRPVEVPAERQQILIF
ncbi:hypothetical protein GGR26_001247 [Lewinella marina]|uniref:NlpC/P60 domain-containing protein n=1 Tax=Neolewinella marina TaxID=438751 RepID=A0A2G0CFQ6_9BACT|nr:NlpC/P60 family protein [Neolewinella marina]NJB85502.1 hypothetical protein [Neolewinella marina]PHK98809.1 hypothetical protein CGL56_10120 [Neolewinella marina]